MTVQIAESTFSDPGLGLPQVETLVPRRVTSADTDAALVASWLRMFDPVDSARTLVLYRRVAGAFMHWVVSRGVCLATLTAEDLAAWRDQLRGAAATRANRLAVAKSLLAHAHRTGYVRFNVGRAVRGPKIDVNADNRSLTEIEIGLMIQAASSALRTERARPKPRRRFVRTALTKLYLARFLYYSACRVAEALAAKWTDLQARPDGDFQLTVVGKGRRRRSFPLPATFVAQLEVEYKSGNASQDARLFPFGARRAQTIVGDLAALAGIERAVSPHWFRHAAATHALDRGAPIHVVAQTLGHASLATTSRYAHKRADGAARYLPRI